ncbi:MAG: zinc-binding dehydrogenase [Sphingobacteriales bacterium]|nr:MAG: zinc-binding dehydrogenase [Sphingobacteriales bacterium]
MQKLIKDILKYKVPILILILFIILNSIFVYEKLNATIKYLTDNESTLLISPIHSFKINDKQIDKAINIFDLSNIYSSNEIHRTILNKINPIFIDDVIDAHYIKYFIIISIYLFFYLLIISTNSLSIKNNKLPFLKYFKYALLFITTISLLLELSNNFQIIFQYENLDIYIDDLYLNHRIMLNKVLKIIITISIMISIFNQLLINNFNTNMQAIYLVKNGTPEKAFEFRSIQKTEPNADEVAVLVEASGINFADVVARLGNYQDCPPLPTIIGYEVVGRVDKVGKDVQHLKVGDRVLAFTRFGGYSQYITQKENAVSKIPEDMDAGKALALATQYSTAYYACHVATNVLPNETVLIHAGAGGVGTALIQLCKLRNAKIYSTAGSDAKLEYLRNQGVDVPINYTSQDFSKIINEPIDVAFDSLGAENFRKSYKLLNKGGRIVGYGASSMTDAKNIVSKGIMAAEFGFYHPAQLLMESRSMIGVNMLRIADYKPDTLKYCMDSVIELLVNNKIAPEVGKMYAAKDIYQAHTDMENRKTMGKIGIIW